ncbi:MAG TPA: hypothetical protein QF753_07945 [Victivallales bacterium]|nr:hypothetical protein [Victivallales bacterium]
MNKESFKNYKFEDKVPNFIRNTIRKARLRKKNANVEVNILDKINIVELMDF